MGNHLKSKSNAGLSLIATVLALLLFSLFIAVAVSLVTTGASIGLQEEQGVQAFYIADGGIERALRALQDGSSCNDLNTLTNIDLGNGRFTITPTQYRPIPSARLLNDINPVQTTIQSNTADLIAAGYAPSGRIFIQNDPPPGTEAIDYTSISGDTFLDCMRSVAGTIPSGHNAGRRIVQNQCDIISTGTISSNPLASVQRQVRVSAQP